MRLLGRATLVALALLLAVSAGALFLALAPLFDPVVGRFVGEVAWTGLWALLDSVAALDDPEPLVREAFVGLSGLGTTLLVAPPVFVALVGEVAGLRALAWYAGGTGAVTAAIPWLLRPAPRPATGEEIHIVLALFLTGAVAGLVYWALAGHGAGRRQAEPAAQTGRPDSRP